MEQIKKEMYYIFFNNFFCKRKRKIIKSKFKKELEFEDTQNFD